MKKLIKEILNSEDDLVRIVLGDFGIEFKNFLKLIDPSHPDLDFIFKNYYGGSKDFIENYLGLFKIIKYAKKNNHLSSLFFLENSLKPFNKNSLFNKFYNIRLLKNQKERNRLRSLKRPQHIDLYFIYKENRDFWDDYPDSFYIFERNNTSYKKDILISEKKKKRYELMGCHQLAKEVEDSIEDIKSFNTLYYGFHKINVITSSILLAKILKYNFKKNKITVEQNNMIFDYEPYVFPATELFDVFSKEVRNKIKYLEHYPEANNKPIFDSFFLVVPSFNVISKEGGLYSYFEFEKKRLFNNRKEAFKEMIKFMLKNEIFSASLHGEKDGESYFIDLI